ncbi:peptidase inhibitor family I36 protein [Streptomyces sp. NRRL F-5135]|uniref:peptidase inhibitor family I36 protein n=1 Tax=Streptomyces sp. NRRL F-5135 TaxID=1463858 RepID=UPI0004C4B7A0|nr:peptidase inhibitor family I36 protein [Streptomyces sp. NRRL F-5135]
MRTRPTVPLAVSAAFAGVVATAPVAAAAPAPEPAPPGCAKGYVCAYSGERQTGRLLLMARGDWSGAVSGVRSIVNNGDKRTGAGHVQLTWRYDGGTWTDCFTPRPGPGMYKADVDSITVTRAVWRGTC